MLELLMEGRPVPKLEVAKKEKISASNEKILAQLKLEISRLQEELKTNKRDLEYLIQNVEIKSSAFGPDYLKLNIPRSELAHYKIAIKQRN